MPPAIVSLTASIMPKTKQTTRNDNLGSKTDVSASARERPLLGLIHRKVSKAERQLSAPAYPFPPQRDCGTIFLLTPD